MRVLKLTVLILLALVVVVVGIGSFLPKDFTVERSIEISASPEAVFDEVSSLRKWDAWSPWLARDPSIVNTYSGPESGAGATVTWGLTGPTSGPVAGYFAKMMDHWVGADYRDGLARLKEVVEAMPTGE